MALGNKKLMQDKNRNRSYRHEEIKHTGDSLKSENNTRETN